MSDPRIGRPIKNKEIKMNLEKDVFVIYSPDEEIYYLEDAVPSDWKSSAEVWDTFIDAEDAYYDKEFSWEK